MTEFNDVVKKLGLKSRQALYIRINQCELDPVTKEKAGRTYKRVFSDSDIETLKNMPINKGGRGRKTKRNL